MAKEYIEREDAANVVMNSPTQKRAFDRINTLPAADVAPVRRGRWIDKNAGNATCSVCHRRHKDVYDDDNSDSFCRSCGAKIEVQDGD